MGVRGGGWVVFVVWDVDGLCKGCGYAAGTVSLGRYLCYSAGIVASFLEVNIPTFHMFLRELTIPWYHVFTSPQQRNSDAAQKPLSPPPSRQRLRHQAPPLGFA